MNRAMSDRKKRASSISPAELEVLKILWEESPMTADSIILQLNSDQSTHPRTVKTLLNRLVKKGAIGFKEEGRRYHYFSVLDRDKYFKHETLSFLDRYFDGQLSPLISYFARQKQLNTEDLAELERLIEKAKEENNE